MTTKEKYLSFEHGDHFIFTTDLTYGLVDRMVQTIETGTADRKYTSLSPLTLLNMWLSYFDIMMDLLFVVIAENYIWRKKKGKWITIPL